MNTILSLEGLATLGASQKLSDAIISNFIKPDNILKSSVGEYYQTNMEFFIQTRKQVFDHLSGRFPDKTCHFIANSVLPLGARVDDNEYESWFYLSSKLLEVQTMPVKSDGLLGSYDKADEKTLALVKAQQKAVEHVAQGICAGYTPKRDVARTTYIRNDSGFYQEHLIANLLYPWVMQPLNQLRMLVPSIDTEIWKAMLAQYMAGTVEDLLALRTGLDCGYPLTYEFVSDFQAYMSFRQAQKTLPVQLQRQMWTPFFGIADAERYDRVITDKPLHERILKCFTQSKRLYVEMLKTGLGYESQYAVLLGFAGRFMVSGGLGGLLALTHWKNTENYCLSAVDLVADMTCEKPGFTSDCQLFTKAQEHEKTDG